MARPVRVTPSEAYYLSPDGDDEWSGTLPAPNAERTDGPFASFDKVKAALRHLKAHGCLAPQTTVCLRGGRYELDAPLTFEPADSMPVTFRAYEGETPILDGGTRITGWQTTEVNGRTAWVADLPEVAKGEWFFRSLFVDGERRGRPCLPKEGRVRIEDVEGMPLPNNWRAEHYDRFRLPKGTMRAFRNLSDVEILAFHFWIDERFPIAAFDPETETITTARPSRAPLVEAHGSELAPCYIENVFEALTDPGEWYLDRTEGTLYYLPRPGEDPETTEVRAPRLLQLLRITGAPAEERFVEFLRFEGIRFETTDWVQPGPEVEDRLAPAFRPGRAQHRRYRGALASSCQGAADVPGALYLEGARACAIEDCTVAHAGWYGVQLADGCVGNRIVGNELFDLGAGGVHLDGAAANELPSLSNRSNRVTDNHIHHGGEVFHSGIGILSMHSADNDLSHNHIHDFYYSGISIGWNWGYEPQAARDVRVEKNHIHHLGKGVLSDMGGIYTLGVQPGTVLRGNVIHDIEKLNYGAWCIYPDEGSSHILIEKNLCYRTNAEAFHQHYGRENIVRNNIFAFGGERLLAHGRVDPEHNAFSMERNILVTNGVPIFGGGYAHSLQQRNHRSDLNIIWDVSGEPPRFCGGKRESTIVDFEGWQALGMDIHSSVADPGFRDAANDDFALAEDSPAWAMGFEPLELDDVGPRAKDDRTDAPIPW